MTEPLLAKTLVRDDQVRSFHVEPAPAVGWETSERADEQVVKQQRYTDWHRVERTLTRFTREIDVLREQGWREPDSKG